MALVIEDGSIVAGADSYASAAELSVYLQARQLTDLPEPQAESLLIQAGQYLNGFEQRYRGTRVSAAQFMSWPRTDANVNGFDLLDTDIPQQLKFAQMQLALEGANGFEFYTSTDGTYVIREKVDVLETQYASPADLASAGRATPTFPAVDALLRPLLRGRPQLMTARAW